MAAAGREKQDAYEPSRPNLTLGYSAVNQQAGVDGGLLSAQIWRPNEGEPIHSSYKRTVKWRCNNH